MCPRLTKKRVTITDPNILLPELPSPNDLKPFPTRMSIEYSFHTSCVRSISVSPCARYLASGDEDHNLVIWDIKTGRILRKYKLENKVIDCVGWCPNKNNCLVSATNEEFVYIFAPGLYTKAQVTETQESLERLEAQYTLDAKASDTKEKFVQWTFEDDYLGIKSIKMKFKNIISKMVWHSKGDYFATMMHNIQTSS